MGSVQKRGVTSRSYYKLEEMDKKHRILEQRCESAGSRVLARFLDALLRASSR